MAYSLKDIFLGHNDGRKEALYRQDFENYFFNYEDIVQKTLAPTTYLVLGRKGTGKSLLGEYIYKTKQTDNRNITLISFEEFRFHQLRELRTNDPAPNEYSAIWTWILLIELAKLLLENKNLQTSEIYGQLKKFIAQDYSGLLLTQQADIDIRKLNHVQGNFLTPSSSQNGDSYVRYIPELERCIQELAREAPQQEYLLLLDELDDRFTREEEYLDGLVSLIKASNRLNVNLLKKGFHIRIILFLRTDIFALLNDTNLNKIRIDNSVLIDWGSGRKSSFDSPLFDLVTNKIKVSLPEFTTSTKQLLLNRFFQPQIGLIETGLFLLERTFFRPRDIIAYLSLAQKMSPNAKSFDAPTLLDIEKQYSDNLYEEIRNELNGHIDEARLQEIFNLIKHMARSQFSYIEIDTFRRQKGYLKDTNLREVFELLFDFSVIGNQWKDSRTQKWHNRWKYRDEKVTVDFDKQFALHAGLRKTFLS